MEASNSYEGGCSCGKLRYRMKGEPLIVHACHCRQCQRITGSAFVMNAVIEKSQVEILTGAASNCHFPGTCQTAYFCPECATYIYSQYPSVGGYLSACWFVRVGTLDNPDKFPADVHIFTSSKQPWMPIPETSPRFDAFYKISDVWQQSSIDRMEPYWRNGPKR